MLEFGLERLRVWAGSQGSVSSENLSRAGDLLRKLPLGRARATARPRPRETGPKLCHAIPTPAVCGQRTVCATLAAPNFDRPNERHVLWKTWLELWEVLEETRLKSTPFKASCQWPTCLLAVTKRNGTLQWTHAACSVAYTACQANNQKKKKKTHLRPRKLGCMARQMCEGGREAKATDPKSGPNLQSCKDWLVSLPPCPSQGLGERTMLCSSPLVAPRCHLRCPRLEMRGQQPWRIGKSTPRGVGYITVYTHHVPLGKMERKSSVLQFPALKGILCTRSGRCCCQEIGKARE